MQLASRMCFPEGYLVTDRFHVVKLMEALQHKNKIQMGGEKRKTKQ
jgi:CRP-like cAMP-binding protein